MNTPPQVQVGNRIRRIKGRNPGAEGRVTYVSSPDVIGSAGDVLIVVACDDGYVFDCYTRQVEVI